MKMVEITVNEALKSFGLSEKEINIYLACLELGTAPANEIANKAKINRSTTYDILKSFLEKGIASRVIRKRTTHFEVTSPEKLIAQLDEKKNKIQSVLDQLKLIEERVVKKPTVEVYEGHAGVKTILEDVLNSKKQTDVISTSKIFDTFVYYFPHYIEKRKKLNIKSRVLQEASPQTTKLKQRDKSENRTTRALKNFEINSVTFIYSDKVAIIKLSKDNLIGVLISDKTLAEDQRRIFEILWANGK